MADSANTFTGLIPLLKEAYASKTHKRPGKHEYFLNLKKKLRKN